MDTRTISVTAFGETREVECWVGNEKAYSLRRTVVGRFPTGTKLHPVQLDLYKRNTAYTDPATGEVRERKPLQGPTAAVIDGEEFVLGTTLYIHNSNRGRIVAWDDEKWDAHRGLWR